MTIVIPSYQRLDHINALLDSVETATAGREAPPIDVVVVLDGSTDGSREHLELRRRDFPVPLTVVWQANAGPAAARNRCIDAARGRLVWMLDDDMLIDRGAMERHREWDRDIASILMGPCEIRSNEFTATQAQSWYDARHEALGRSRFVKDPGLLAFANTSAPKELMRKHRFDERFRGYGMEDLDLAVRLTDAGVTVAFDPAAAVRHAFTPSPLERLRKLREEGVNRVRFVALHPDRREVIFEAEPGRFVATLRRLQRPAMSRPL